MEKETTTNEIMEFLKESMATKEDLDIQAEKFRKDLGLQEHRILDSMDDKLSDLKGDLVVLMRKEDKKVSELISVLRDKQVLTDEEADRLMAMNPFPQAAN